MARRFYDVKVYDTEKNEQETIEGLAYTQAYAIERVFVRIGVKFQIKRYLADGCEVKYEGAGLR